LGFVHHHVFENDWVTCMCFPVKFRLGQVHSSRSHHQGHSTIFKKRQNFYGVLEAWLLFFQLLDDWLGLQ
jgi:hypothetical protein